MLIYILPTLILLGLITSSVVERFERNKFRLPVPFFTMFFVGTFQWVYAFITSFTKMTYKTMQIISYCLLSLSILLFLVYVVYHFVIAKKNNQDFIKALMSSIKQNIVFWISIFIYIIISLFITNSFVDIGYYLQLSSNFTIDKVPKFDDAYRYASSYYVYAVFSNDNIPVWYYFFTPFLFYVCFGSVLNRWIITQHIKNRYLWAIQIPWFIAITLLFIFFEPTISSGNLIIQSSLILMILMCFHTKQLKLIPITLLFSQFFSVTGALVSFVIMIGLIVYFIIFSSFREYIKHSYWLLSIATIGSFMALSVTKNITYIKIGFALVLCGSLVLSMIGPLISLLIKNGKHKFLDYKIGEQKWINSKYTMYSVFAVVLIAMIITLVYFCTSYNYFKPQIDQKVIISVFGIIMTGITFAMVYLRFYKKDENKENYWFLLLINYLIIFLFVLFIWIGNVNNASIWRITYATSYITFDAMNVIFLLIYICWLIYNLLSNEKIFEKLHLQNLLTKFNSNNKLKVTGFSFISALSTIAFSLVLVISTSINFPEKLNFTKFSKDITINRNLFTNKDIDVLKKINQSNVINYATDCMSTIYLNKKTNNTIDFTRNVWKHLDPNLKFDENVKEPWWWYTRFNFYNVGALLSPILHADLDKFSNALSTYINGNNWSSTNLIVLNKSTPYYQSVIRSITKNLIKYEADTIAIISNL